MTGTLVAHYQVQEKLGEGGMGVVYQALDTRLGRTVVLKFLKQEYTDRFEREAHALSSLNHPHICTLHDAGRHKGTCYLVMERIEGRPVEGPLPVSEALRYAVQIADAIDAAHRRGFVHRDLKPDNILITRNGVKLLDFGLAKPCGTPAPADPDPAARTVTAQGLVVGTPQYMAPEQLHGREADPRTDVFAFGLVLYEMLTGRRAFDGESAASVIAAVLERDPPPPSAVRPSVPRTLDWVIEGCLRKNPDDRWQTLHDVKLHLTQLAEAGSGALAAVRTLRRRRWRFWAAGAALLAAGAALGAWSARARSAAAPAPAVQFEVYPPPRATFTSQSASVPVPEFALSPDGKLLVFVATQDGPEMLWLRPLDDSRARPLQGTEGAAFPFYSPGGRSIGFFSQGKLKRIDLDSRVVEELCDSPSEVRGAAWTGDGWIVFSGNTDRLMRVRESGGQPEPVSAADEPGPVLRRWPQVLPGGRYLYHVRGARPALYAGSWDGKPSKRIANSYWEGKYVEPGYLLAIQGGTLTAQPFHPRTLELSGKPVPLARPVRGSTTAYGGFAVSGNGVLAYASGVMPRCRLEWYDRGGRSLGPLEKAPEGDYTDFALSPTGREVAFSLVDPKDNAPDIWVQDAARGTASRLTFDPQVDASPVWSPDSSRLAFRSNSAGPGAVYQLGLAGGSPAGERLLHTREEWPQRPGPTNFVPTDWSRDSKHLILTVTGLAGNIDVFGYSLETKSWLPPLAATPFREMHGRLSPDGKWLALTSDESGRWEVYVQTFPAPSRRIQVSTNGGSEPRWRADGGELYYLDSRRTLMAAAVRKGTAFEAERPRELFRAPLPPGVNPFRSSYDAADDGQRFLVQSLVEQVPPSPITVVMGWTRALSTSF